MFTTKVPTSHVSPITEENKKTTFTFLYFYEKRRLNYVCNLFVVVPLKKKTIIFQIYRV